MSRKSIPIEEKKKKIAITLDEKLSEMLNEHLNNIDMPNRSKYIENLIRKDMLSKGVELNEKFIASEEKAFKEIKKQLLISRQKFKICKSIKSKINSNIYLKHSNFWGLCYQSMLKDCIQTLANIFTDTRKDVLSNIHKNVSSDNRAIWLKFEEKHSKLLSKIKSHRNKIISHLSIELFISNCKIWKIEMDELELFFTDFPNFTNEFEDIQHIYTNSISDIDSIFHQLENIYIVDEIRINSHKNNPIS